MSDSTLPMQTVYGPRYQLGEMSSLWGSGGADMLHEPSFDHDAYLCYFNYCGPPLEEEWEAELPPVEPSPPSEPVQQLEEVVVTAPLPPAITPPAPPPAPSLGFQGPMPSPAPGGGGGGTSFPTTTTPAPASQPSYKVPKASALRVARFMLEKFLKNVAPYVRNILPRIPTPMTFLGEALLKPTQLADATLYPRNSQLLLPIEARDTWTMLPEQIVSPMPNMIGQFSTPITLEPIRWTIPNIQPAPLPWFMPDPIELPSAPMLPSPSLKPSNSPTPFATPTPIELPLPFENPSSTAMPIAPVGIPFSPAAPSIPALTPSTPASPFMPFSPAPFSPAAPAPFVPSLSPAPAPSMTPTRSDRCKPCPRTKDSEIEKPRTVCYAKLVKERRNPKSDKQVKWRKIKCQ